MSAATRHSFSVAYSSVAITSRWVSPMSFGGSSTQVGRVPAKLSDFFADGLFVSFLPTDLLGALTRAGSDSTAVVCSWTFSSSLATGSAASFESTGSDRTTVSFGFAFFERVLSDFFDLLLVLEEAFLADDLVAGLSADSAFACVFSIAFGVSG